jgi:hypothetical protein
MRKSISIVINITKPPGLGKHMYPVARAHCEAVCKLQDIDSSHDHFHMARVADTALYLNSLCGRKVSKEEEDVMILSAFTHDLCDRKYTDVEKGLSELRTWLTSLPISSEQTQAVLHIINTMSYSKVSKHGYPVDLGRWSTAYHHVRVADLIDAYDIHRCYAYQEHAHPEMEEREKWKAVIDLFERRMLTQLDAYILPVCPYAESIARPRHDQAVSAIKYLKGVYL